MIPNLATVRAPENTQPVTSWFLGPNGCFIGNYEISRQAWILAIFFLITPSTFDELYASYPGRCTIVTKYVRIADVSTGYIRPSNGHRKVQDLSLTSFGSPSVIITEEHI